MKKLFCGKQRAPHHNLGALLKPSWIQPILKIREHQTKSE